MYRIGVDIGGMSIKVGIVDEYGNITLKDRVKTNHNPEIAVEDIVNQIYNLLDKSKLTLSEIKGIGIGCPGAVTSATGEVAYLPNLGWKNIPLSSMLKKYIDLPIIVSNDANVAALGETIYGSAKNYNTTVMFTLGTGVGGGVIIDKKLFEGNMSRGTELGHTTLFLDGKQCSCGRRGCIECYTSATALIEQTKEAMINDKDSKMWNFADNNIDNVDGRTAFECAKTGDLTANKVVDTYVYYLAESLINMFNIFRPDAFIIGGGISGQGEYLTSKLKTYCEKFDYGYKGAPKTEILVASLGNDAGIIGAAALI